MKLAGWTGLEPAAFRVTGGRYNQLNYHPASHGSEIYTDPGSEVQLIFIRLETQTNAQSLSN